MFFVRYKFRHIERSNTIRCTHYSDLSFVRIWHLLMTQPNCAMSKPYSRNCSGAPSVIWNLHIVLVHPVERIIETKRRDLSVLSDSHVFVCVLRSSHFPRWLLNFRKTRFATRTFTRRIIQSKSDNAYDLLGTEGRPPLWAALHWALPPTWRSRTMRGR